MHDAAWVVALLVAVGAIVWGAESFAEHLSAASVRLGVSAFALALLLAGAEPEELATAVVAAVRRVPAVALGDVIGANVAACLVALGVGACLRPLPFGTRVLRYAALGLPAGVVATVTMWDGHVGRAEGALLVVLYVAYVGTIWILERRPPALGEAEELDEAKAEAAAGGTGVRARVGRELVLVVAGVAAMAVGATVLVEAVRRITSVESSQTDLSLTVVGFVTAFELVVLAWSASRRGASEAVVAAVVGSFAYNATMTLGAAALVRPLTVVDAQRLHVPALQMIGALALVIVLGVRRRSLGRADGVLLLALYPLFLLSVALR
jgi:cation:H+ antiporter